MELGSLPTTSTLSVRYNARGQTPSLDPKPCPEHLKPSLHIPGAVGDAAGIQIWTDRSLKAFCPLNRRGAYLRCTGPQSTLLPNWEATFWGFSLPFFRSFLESLSSQKASDLPHDLTQKVGHSLTGCAVVAQSLSSVRRLLQIISNSGGKDYLGPSQALCWPWNGEEGGRAPIALEGVWGERDGGATEQGYTEIETTAEKDGCCPVGTSLLASLSLLNETCLSRRIISKRLAVVLVTHYNEISVVFLIKWLNINNRLRIIPDTLSVLHFYSYYHNGIYSLYFLHNSQKLKKRPAK